jgi:hypothetical protein
LISLEFVAPPFAAASLFSVAAFVIGNLVRRRSRPMNSMPADSNTWRIESSLAVMSGWSD